MKIDVDNIVNDVIKNYNENGIIDWNLASQYIYDRYTLSYYIEADDIKIYLKEKGYVEFIYDELFCDGSSYTNHCLFESAEMLKYWLFDNLFEVFQANNIDLKYSFSEKEFIENYSSEKFRSIFENERLIENPTIKQWYEKLLSL